jgi:uncharacterized protein (TIGR03435 family)
MRLHPSLLVVALVVSVQALSQAPSAPTFEVASVRPSAQEVGPDYNNQITITPAAFTAHNVTLKRLIADAWHCQLNQVIGAPWIDHNEYDVDARLPEGSKEDQIPLMLRRLLADRFRLRQHNEEHPMRAYELTTAPGGPKIHPIRATTDSPADAAPARPGFHFHGDMHQFADLLAVQFSIPAADNPSVPVRAGGPPIPVLDKTGLKGIYDFTANIRPEPGTDAFTAWKRVLAEQLGLAIDSTKGDVPVIVVDAAAKVPTEN